MNYETDIAERLAAGKDAATIAAEINAERRLLTSNYRAIKSTEAADWLASDGRIVRVDAALSAATEHAAYAVLASAWDGVKAIRSNPNATLRVAPGEKHRQVVELAISAGVMITDDLTSLDAIAYIGTEETAETVQAAIDLYNSDAAQWQRAVTAGALVIEAGGTFAEAMSAAGGV